MLRLFSPVPTKKGFKPFKPQNVRHLHIGFGQPSVSDPAGAIVIIETSHARDPETNEPIGQNYWTGWQARFIAWLINKLLPLPEVWNVTRTK